MQSLSEQLRRLSSD
ncbi:MULTISPECIES: hypothetical protein [Enterobacteriaceae]|nr:MULTISPECIES: hypothetical protein [Enterobacteriaceae]